MGQVLDEIYFTVGKETSSNLKAASNLINCGCQCSRSSNVWGWSLMRSWPLIILVINFLDNLQWGGDHIDDLRWGWPSMRLIRSYWWSASLDLKLLPMSEAISQPHLRRLSGAGSGQLSHGWLNWSTMVLHFSRVNLPGFNNEIATKLIKCRVIIAFVWPSKTPGSNYFNPFSVQPVVLRSLRNSTARLLSVSQQHRRSIFGENKYLHQTFCSFFNCFLNS